MDCFLFENGLRHERVTGLIFNTYNICLIISHVALETVQ